MRIETSKKFDKQFSKLPKKIRLKFSERAVLFLRDKTSPVLNNHQLKGKFKRHYSINITRDIRAIYKIVGDEIYFFLLIGTHSELY